MINFKHFKPFSLFPQLQTLTMPAQPPVLVPQQQPQQVAAQQQPQQRRSLTLTREQMLEAQEMFRTANKVTRPEKALILGFMAGSRDNPCPHLGKNPYRLRIPIYKSRFIDKIFLKVISDLKRLLKLKTIIFGT